MMRNPTNFLEVNYFCHPTKGFRRLPAGLTKSKVYLLVRDSRGVFSYESGIVLLDEFKRVLEVIYSFISVYATDMDTDIVAKFSSEEGIPLGYFYQGEYHLWEK